MSKLPPALAARLAKRGLLNTATEQRPQLQPAQVKYEEEEEEVIAEDYDDLKPAEQLNNLQSQSTMPTFDLKIRDTVPGCPNKYNIYHNCNGYCAKFYADVPTEPKKSLKKKFSRLLLKYPLPASGVWEQIYDPGMKTFYFWNTQTDQVSWLPPSHPKAKMSLPAEKLRKLLREDTTGDESDGEHAEEDESDDDNSDQEDEMSDESDDDDDSSSSAEMEHQTATKRIRREFIARRNQLDPMDPAAYSDTPRGKWSDGLKKAQQGND